MLKLKFILSFIVISSLIFVGCQKETSVEPNGMSNSQLSKLGLPLGAIFESATLYINNISQNGATVNVHRITNSWTELGVTWNNFAGAYSPDVEGFFTANSGLQSADVSDLVEEWLNETYANYGLLLKQVQLNADISEYDSRETVNDPYLVIRYTLDGQLHSETIQAIADTYIWNLPGEENSNFGDETYLYVGYRNGYEKQTLIKFDNHVPTMGCETAYAFGGDLATCFLSINNITGNNWGWTNMISSPGTYIWPIYAGAGQCDTDKGTLIGSFKVVYSGTTATISYTAEAPYTISESHLWVGGDKLPKNKKGQYITAPGQFLYNGYSNPLVINNLSTPFYVAAHFGVCWQQ